jgi:hypothetical protein
VNARGTIGSGTARVIWERSGCQRGRGEPLRFVARLKNILTRWNPGREVPSCRT